ncbi:MAG: hypothetical protein M3505_03095, partial [Verrucomicrobiota bacterium]|nr:hypothetical protein [Verrucomicrobiota bacterium]
KWFTPSVKAQFISDDLGVGVGYAIDEAGNIVQGTGNDLYYNSTRIPLVTTYRGVANAVRNGRVVGVNNGDQRAFMYSPWEAR